MKKVFLLTALLILFACSKDDAGESSSSEPQTFLEKYDGTSWKDSSETEITTFYNATYFYNYVDYADSDSGESEMECLSIKAGFQTIDGDQVEITKNDGLNDLLVEVSVNGELSRRTRLSVEGDMMTERSTFWDDEDGSTLDVTYIWTRTNALYSDYCN